VPSNPVDHYDRAYSNFENAVEAAVRREAYGEDIGQTSWTTAAEWLRLAGSLAVGRESEVLEVGSGSGGPAVHLATTLGCRVTGVDINEHGVKNATALAAARGLADRVRFQTVEAGTPLPFSDARFDAVICNDAICHLGDRLSALRDWHRLLRPRGRMLFTDALVVTGPLSLEEIKARSASGPYLFVPSGANERLIRGAGFELLGVEDVTPGAMEIAARRREARARHREELIPLEGEAAFEALQGYLACAERLLAEGRLTRFSYLAETRGVAATDETPAATRDVTAVVQRLFAAWNAGDAESFAGLFTPDADYVGGDGLWRKGSAAIRALCPAAPDSPRVAMRGEPEVRLHGGVATCTFRWETEGAGPGRREGVISCVAVIDEGRWALAHLQNTDLR
jgi:uncharacterized protein (TIGR02246 family)